MEAGTGEGRIPFVALFTGAGDEGASEGATFPRPSLSSLPLSTLTSASFSISSSESYKKSESEAEGAPQKFAKALMAAVSGTALVGEVTTCLGGRGGRSSNGPV